MTAGALPEVDEAGCFDGSDRGSSPDLRRPVVGGHWGFAGIWSFAPGCRPRDLRRPVVMRVPWDLGIGHFPGFPCFPGTLAGKGPARVIDWGTFRAPSRWTGTPGDHPVTDPRENSMNRPALLLLAAGDDRPGIVDSMSGLVYRTGCNLEDSRMSVLGGAFALMVLVTGTEHQLTILEEEARRLGAELALIVDSKRTQAPRGPAEGPGAVHRIRAVAMDHPGIVHRLTHVLSREGVNVVNLETSVSQAPTTGTPMFSLVLDAQIPADVDLPGLRERLVEVGEEEDIDLEFEEP